MKAAFVSAVLALGSACCVAQAAADKQPDPFAAASKDDCVFVNDIQNWRVLDSRNIVLYAPNARRAYLLQLGMPISDLKFAFRVAFVDSDRDGQLCGRSPDKVAADGSMVRQPSTIMGMTRLDDEHMKALEAKYNVKLVPKKSAADSKGSEQPATTPAPVS